MNVIALPPGSTVDGVGKDPHDLVLVRNWMPAGARKMIHHPNITFAIIQSGEVAEESGSGFTARNHGDIHFHAPGEWEVRIGGQAAESFGGTLNEAILPDDPKVTIKDIESQPPLSGANRLGAQLLAEYNRGDSQSPLCIQGLFLEIVSRLSRVALPEEHSHPAWLRRARDLLEDSPSSSYSLNDIARECGINPSHLSRTFRRHFGVTLGEYHRAVRLNFAYALLSSSESTIGDVAAHAGYADHAHLTRAMKAASGSAPIDIRRSPLSPCQLERAFGSHFRTIRFLSGAHSLR